MWLPPAGLIAASSADVELAIELLTHDGNDSNATNRSTSNATLSAGDRIVGLCFGKETTGGAPAPTLTRYEGGFGGTWSFNYLSVSGAVGSRHTLLAATAIVPADITVNLADIGIASDEQCNRWGWALLRVTGVADVTILKGGTATGTGSITPALASTAGVGAIQIAACASVGLAPGGAAAAEGGWTLISDSDDYPDTTQTWMGVAYRIGGGDDDCAFTGLSTTQNLGLIFELAGA